MGIETIVRRAAKPDWQKKGKFWNFSPQMKYQTINYSCGKCHEKSSAIVNTILGPYTAPCDHCGKINRMDKAYAGSSRK